MKNYIKTFIIQLILLISSLFISKLNKCKPNTKNLTIKQINSTYMHTTPLTSILDHQLDSFYQNKNTSHKNLKNVVNIFF